MLVFIAADVFWSVSFLPIVPWTVYFLLHFSSDFLEVGKDFGVLTVSWRHFLTPGLESVDLLLSSFCLFLFIVLKNPEHRYKSETRGSRATDGPQDQDGMWAGLAHPPHLSGVLKGLSFLLPRDLGV